MEYWCTMLSITITRGKRGIHISYSYTLNKSRNFERFLLMYRMLHIYFKCYSSFLWNSDIWHDLITLIFHLSISDIYSIIYLFIYSFFPCSYTHISSFQQKHTEHQLYVRYWAQCCGGFKDASKASPTSRLEKTGSFSHFSSIVYRKECHMPGSVLASDKPSFKVLQS